jgi:hypothetical protein
MMGVDFLYHGQFHCQSDQLHPEMVLPSTSYNSGDSIPFFPLLSLHFQPLQSFYKIANSAFSSSSTNLFNIPSGRLVPFFLLFISPVGIVTHTVLTHHLFLSHLQLFVALSTPSSDLQYYF